MYTDPATQWMFGFLICMAKALLTVIILKEIIKILLFLCLFGKIHCRTNRTVISYFMNNMSSLCCVCRYRQKFVRFVLFQQNQTNGRGDLRMIAIDTIFHDLAISMEYSIFIFSCQPWTDECNHQY